MQRTGQEQQQNDGNLIIYWIWLKHIPGIGNHLMHNLLEMFENPQKIYLASVKELMEAEGIGVEKARKIFEQKSLESARHIWLECLKNQIHILTILDSGYPEELRKQKELPVYLYYKGILKDSITGVAIVGARRCSADGKQKAVEYAEQLVGKSIPVISGMAKGIDSYAHTACLKSGGYTIAVLGNGLDICYPSEHRILKERIEQKGLLLSEYDPGTKPQKSYFPQRNRIIAALADEIIVVEAGRKSGALITADCGEKYGKKVLVLENKKP